MKIFNPVGFQIEDHVVRMSPNRSRRLWLPHLRPRVALVHATASDDIHGTLQWFQDRRSRVSADFVIGKDGRIVRMVPRGFCAWHAGVGLWQGKPIRAYNYISYGIELVNRDDGKDPYPDRQIEALSYVLAHIQEECPSVEYIRRHADIAWPLGRKLDPNGLSLEHIYRAVHTYQPCARWR